jgi:hypothetical protein
MKMLETPSRVQRSRRRGAKLVSPNGLRIVCVTRPGKWGNPIVVGEVDRVTGRTIDGPMAVRLYRLMALQTAWPGFRQQMREELGGCNLACYCPLDRPCHADVLLIIANTTEAELADPDSKAWKELYALAPYPEEQQQ